MKITITILFLSLNSFSFSQPFPEIRPITKDVVEIKQVNFNGIIRSGWISFYSYKDGDRLSQRNYYRNELRLDENYEYSKGENWIKIKNTYTNNRGFSIRVIHYDNNKLIVKSELYIDEDTLKPVQVSHDFIYGINKNLESYKVTNYYKVTGIERTDCFELNYQNGLLSSILLYDSCKKLNKSVKVKYNSTGHPTSEIIDFQDPQIHAAGGRSENGIMRFYYKFDKKGNWIKRYYVTSSGRRIKEIKRKIKYKTGA